MCMECQKQFGIPSFEPIIADYYEGATAYIECANGHSSALVLQSQKFEVLLESAANAILEGYTIEAASTFSAAYERFFEFAIKVFCKKHKIEDTPLKNTFNQVSKQSERQIGAFLFLYLISFNKEYKLNEKITNFRNKVIHKGHIPTPKEVIDFGELIYQEIYSITQLLKNTFPDELQKTVFDDLVARNKAVSNGIPRATSTGAMFFCLSTMSEQKPNLKEALTAYKEAREMIIGAMPYMEALNKFVSIYVNKKG